MVERRLLTSLVIKLKEISEPSCYGLFFVLEVVDERQDEVSDQAD